VDVKDESWFVEDQFRVSSGPDAFGGGRGMKSIRRLHTHAHTHLSGQLIRMKLSDLGGDLALGDLPLIGLVESQTAVGQVAGGAGALVGGGAEFAAGVAELAQQGGFGVVEDIDGGWVGRRGGGGRECLGHWFSGGSFGCVGDFEGGSWLERGGLDGGNLGGKCVGHELFCACYLSG
jgi:hypothetical protein